MILLNLDKKYYIIYFNYYICLKFIYILLIIIYIKE